MMQPLPLWAWPWLLQRVRGMEPPSFDDWLLWHWQVRLENDLPVITDGPQPRSVPAFPA
jgi:hypothetical protein